jgi:hypothetical protein
MKHLGIQPDPKPAQAERADQEPEPRRGETT